MIIRFQKDLIKPQYRFLIFALLVGLSSFSSCVIAQERGDHRFEREPRSVYESNLEGTWVLNAGDATGRVEFYWVRGTLAGRIWFDVYQTWEELTDLSFNPRTGHLEFMRPAVNEQYSGNLSGNQISGRYIIRGLSYPWEAWRKAGSARQSRIDGQWQINAGDSTGKLELYWARTNWTGRIWFDVYQRWEELREISFDAQTGQLEFTRPDANERYSGTLSGNQILGIYTVWTSYPWEGKREKGPPHSPQIEGRWLINAGNAPGRLEFYSTRGRWAGRIWFEVYQRWEDLTDISFDSRTDHLEFTRPGVNEYYSGAVSRDRLSGTYSVKGPSYRWEARQP